MSDPNKKAAFAEKAGKMFGKLKLGSSATPQQDVGTTATSAPSRPQPSSSSSKATTTATAGSASTPDFIPQAVQFSNDYSRPNPLQLATLPAELRNREQDFFPNAAKGEQGWALKFRNVQRSNASTINLVWVRIIAGGVTKAGWVPKDALTPGEFRRDPMPIDIGTYLVPVQQSSRVSGLTSEQKNSVLYRTIQGLWQAIHDNKETVLAPIAHQNEIELIDRTLYGPEAHHYTNLLYSCIEPSVRKIMYDGKFSAQELLDSSKGVPEITREWPGEEFAVIYAMISTGVTHGLRHHLGSASSDTVAFYIGQSMNAPQRCFTQNSKAHQYSLQHPEIHACRALKYQIHRTGNNTVWIPIVRFKKTDARLGRLGWANFLHIAELSFVVLMKSWSPLLHRTASVEQMGSFARDYEAAVVFKNLIENVAATTGWRPAPLLGTNWATPIFSAMPEDRVWISWYDTERQSWLFRTRATMFQRNTQIRKDNLQVCIGNRCISLPAELLHAGKLNHGDAVHLTFELTCDQAMQNFRPHDMPYFRVPRICANPEIEKVASLGLKFQWVDASEQWKELATQRVKLFKDVRPLAVKSGLRILAHLTQTIYVDGPTTKLPTWVPSNSRNSVKRIEYNHLKQTQTLKTVPQKTVEWPEDNTVGQNRRRLQRYVQDRGSDTTFDNRDGAPIIGNRQACDFCLSLMTTSKCDYSAATHSCFRCRAFNRPCTWTYRGTGETTGLDVKGRPKAPNTVDMLVLGGTLEELGLPTHVHSALKKAKAPEQLVENIDPPFAWEIDLDVAADQAGAPAPQNMEVDSDDEA